MIENILSNLESAFLASPLLGLGASFIAGVLLSFSPCIYPLIPITVGIVGSATSSSKTKGFILSLIFVLGISLVYTILGVISSILGIFLWSLFVNPITYMVLALIFLFLGIVHIGLINIKIPFSPTYNYDSKKGLVSLFIFGMVSGLAIIPCNFPILGAILSLISVKGNIAYGALALFLFSLGYGILLMVLGASTTLLRKLPKTSNWILFIKRMIGIIFIGISVHFFSKFFHLIS